MTNGTNGSLSARLGKIWFPILAFALLTIPIVGIWELLRPDRPVANRVSRLLVVFIALFSLAIIALVTEYFTRSRLLADANVANRRLQMVMASGRSVSWEWDLASGRDYWYGDLRTIFGMPSEQWSGQPDEFFRYLPPDDRERVSQVVTDARVNHKQYEPEFRVVRQDGVVRWVTATGSFYYTKTGEPERWLGMAVDITERKLAERPTNRNVPGLLGSSMTTSISGSRCWRSNWKCGNNRSPNQSISALTLSRREGVFSTYPRMFNPCRTVCTRPNSSTWGLQQRRRASVESYRISTKRGSNSSIPMSLSTCRKRLHLPCSGFYKKLCRTR
jgi:PAS domain S-box-containing protein